RSYGDWSSDVCSSDLLCPPTDVDRMHRRPHGDQPPRSDPANANSIYHAARVTLMRRFSSGMAFNIDYRFAESIDNTSAFGDGVRSEERRVGKECRCGG